MTPEQLAAIKARTDAATPGKWWMGARGKGDPANGPDHHHVSSEKVAQSGWFIKVAELDYDKQGENDATFIANARQDIPDLIAALEAAQAEVNALRDFAIWMTGIPYDFTQHDYFVKNRHLLAGSPA